MVIQCPECTTRFKLSDDKIKPEGVKVRCAKCRHIFTVTPEAAPETTLPPVEPTAEETAASAFETELPVEKVDADTPSPVTDDLWGSDFGESDLDASLGDQEPAAVAEDTSTTAASDWGDSFDESDLGLSSVDDIPAETASPDTDLQLDDNGREEPAADTVQAAFEEESGEIDLGLEESPEEELTSEAFGFEEETLGAGSVDEFAFDEEPSTGEALSADEFSFEEEPSAEAGEDLSGLSFEESATDEFSFESDSDDTADAFSFDEDDLFASESETAAEEDDTSEISFDEPQKEAAEGGDFDFNGISFGENGRDDTTAVESREVIAPAERPKPIEMPEPTPLPPVEPAVSLPPLPKQKRKSPMSSVLRIFLILLLILGAAAGYLLWQGGTTDVSQLINQLTGKQEPTAPAAQIRLPLPNSFFIMNQEAGQLFVVQGEAVNGYPENRSAIAVKGMLHDDKGNMLMQQTVFCGNPLDHEELQTATVAHLEETMNNQFGNVLSNLNVDPGKSIPYMIVFRNLPENVTEFTVEVADSKPGGQR